MASERSPSLTADLQTNADCPYGAQSSLYFSNRLGIISSNSNTNPAESFRKPVSLVDQSETFRLGNDRGTNMELGFDDKIANKIYSAAADDSGDPSMKDESGGFVQEKLLAYLAKLKPGKRIASSPLVKVMEVTDETVTFLIRGRMELLKSDVSVFVRIEATIGKIQLSLDRVRTFVGELHMIQSDVTPINDIRMGLGYDGLIFMGRGAYRLVPVGFGLDIFLGGVSSRGIMLGIDVYLPAPIPLGPTGVGLNGLGGDYAHNFKPRLEAGLIAEPPSLETGDPPDPEPPQPIENPTAVDYARWARNPDEALDRWVAADNDEKTNGIAIRAMFCDIMSNGSIIQLDPVGVAVLLPGPVIILEEKESSFAPTPPLSKRISSWKAPAAAGRSPAE